MSRQPMIDLMNIFLAKGSPKGNLLIILVESLLFYLSHMSDLLKISLAKVSTKCFVTIWIHWLL